MAVQAPQTPELVEVEHAEVKCDGSDDGAAALGHPTVYLNMGTQGWVECPYCDRKFILKEGAASH
ncbi:MAG: zinc-finger domain-containing protein [Alphaproteobacteria bacterium]|jgi:uncharacterized Zn-finger protein